MFCDLLILSYGLNQLLMARRKQPTYYSYSTIRYAEKEGWWRRQWRSIKEEWTEMEAERKNRKENKLKSQLRSAINDNDMLQREYEDEVEALNKKIRDLNNEVSDLTKELCSPERVTNQLFGEKDIINDDGEPK
jgi:archaellum component FlaC